MPLTTEYNHDVVDVFYNFKEQNLIAKYTEKSSLKAILGEKLKNVTILDIGCGFGYHSRWLADEGAIVTGVDISEDQIHLAQKMESENPKGIQYCVDNAAHLAHVANDPDFDLCIMMYVLQSAQSLDELLEYFENAFDHLKVGGKLIGVFDNCYETNIVEKYGYDYDPSIVSVEPGQLFYGSADVDNGQSTFTCRQIKVDKNLVHKMGKMAGFRRTKWCSPKVSRDGLALKGEEFWQDFVNIPVDQYFVMIK